jgi:TRAP-type C4-dicarboxylate transport system permease small subunit
MRLPLAWVYASGLIASIGMVAIALHNLYRLLTDKLDEKDLIMTTDSEDKEIITQAVSGSAEGARKL